MHLISLNIPDLLIPLWRGTFDCDPADDTSTWPWAVLVDDVWEEFGKRIAAITPYLPGCYDRPPRNPAEKINSGYKAWEFTLLLYGLGPMVLYGILPMVYWIHFCKLVRAVRLISQHTITREELTEAAILFVDFIEEFEDLYYQRKPECLHFTRQSIHALSHYANEVVTKGPLICASQWTMERTIGNLVSEIRQPSNLYANLAQRALRRAQHNALLVMAPSLDPDAHKPLFPKWSKEIGGGYALLKAQERYRHHTTTAEGLAISQFLQKHHPHSPDLSLFRADGAYRACRWARLRLSSGITSRSMFSHRENKPNARRGRMAKVSAQASEPLALVSVFGHPRIDLLEESSGTYFACKHLGDNGLAVVKATTINSVVSMIPHLLDGEEYWYMFEKPGMDVADLGGFFEGGEEGEDGDE
ncbi:hypothetical protein HYDPIDRAFT_103912 [Hydnomerulius pinastri MD-312]|uniref:Uncharacterized protein n=1 Tax=Hydnomerulius pinastri MD-312 TaxID=994086 RepID=A0A0C9W5D4_9AGAM|nr:hypothetical protein HYDPIDRAFT_103912 [Hydnomerulius pinastri MD-312]